MKSLEKFKSIVVEEEKADYSKFDALVRAGLANKAQIARLHKILDKMGEERPVFNNADKMIMQNLFNKMVDLISNNKQIFQQTRRAVREETEELDESLKATADYKIGPSGRKVRAHRFKVGDEAQLGSDDVADTKDKTDLKENVLRNDPPFVLVLKRKAIRFYPGDTRVALYYNDKLKKYFSVPYQKSDDIDGVIQAEEVELVESVDVLKQLQNIKDTHQYGKIKHKDGSSSTVDVQTAHNVLSIHKSLNDDNKTKIEDMVNHSKEHFGKIVDFAHKKIK
jgi:hypothetical protein